MEKIWIVDYGDEYHIHDPEWDDGNVITLKRSNATLLTKKDAERIASENGGLAVLF